MILGGTKLVDDVRKASDDVLSFREAIAEVRLTFDIIILSSRIRHY